MPKRASRSPSAASAASATAPLRPPKKAWPVLAWLVPAVLAACSYVTPIRPLVEGYWTGWTTLLGSTSGSQDLRLQLLAALLLVLLCQVVTGPVLGAAKGFYRFCLRCGISTRNGHLPYGRSHACKPWHPNSILVRVRLLKHTGPPQARDDGGVRLSTDRWAEHVGGGDGGDGWDRQGVRVRDREAGHACDSDQVQPANTLASSVKTWPATSHRPDF